MTKILKIMQRFEMNPKTCASMYEHMMFTSLIQTLQFCFGLGTSIEIQVPHVIFNVNWYYIQTESALLNNSSTITKLFVRK